MGVVYVAIAEAVRLAGREFPRRKNDTKTLEGADASPTNKQTNKQKIKQTRSQTNKHA